MYDANRRCLNDTDLKFKNILANAANTIQSRLRDYDETTDPLERNRLKLLYDIVTLEMEKVESGRADSYSRLTGPIKAAMDWGEPSDSSLVRALRGVELFYCENYWVDDVRMVQTSH